MPPSLVGNHVTWSTLCTWHTGAVPDGSPQDLDPGLWMPRAAIRIPPPSHHGLGGGCSWGPWICWLLMHWPPGGKPPAGWFLAGPATRIPSASSPLRRQEKRPASQPKLVSWTWMGAIPFCLDYPWAERGPVPGPLCPSPYGPSQWAQILNLTGPISPVCQRLLSKLVGPLSASPWCRCQLCSQWSSCPGIAVGPWASPVDMHSPGWRPWSCASSGAWMSMHPVHLVGGAHPWATEGFCPPVLGEGSGLWSPSWPWGWDNPCHWTSLGPQAGPMPVEGLTTSPCQWTCRAVQSAALGSSWFWRHSQSSSAKPGVPGWSLWACSPRDWCAAGRWNVHCMLPGTWQLHKCTCPGCSLPSRGLWGQPLMPLSRVAWSLLWMATGPFSVVWCWSLRGPLGWFSSWPWAVPSCLGRGAQIVPKTIEECSRCPGVCVV